MDSSQIIPRNIEGLKSDPPQILYSRLPAILLAFDGQKVTPVALHDYKGKKNVALAFYVFAFTGG